MSTNIRVLKCACKYVSFLYKLKLCYISIETLQIENVSLNFSIENLLPKSEEELFQLMVFHDFPINPEVVVLIQKFILNNTNPEPGVYEIG